jgi:membrane dipeptidase
MSPPALAARPLLRRLAFLAVLAACVVPVALRAVVPDYVESMRNQVRSRPPHQAPPAAAALHQDLVVADMHADSLLWDRDLLERSHQGHVDLPRLQRANVALQCFTVVTKSPRGQNIERNSAQAGDNITLLAIAQGWPLSCWTSLRERALFQSRRLHDLARRSRGALTVIRWRGDLADLLERRATDRRLVGGVLGIEGAHCLEGEVTNVDVLFEAGFRVVGLVHFFDNEVGGSAHGESQGGLTPFGEQVLRRLEELGMFVDLAHASPALIDDVVRLTRRPLLVTHTGLRGVHDNPRNLSDAHVRAIAATGGLIGVGFWETAVGGIDARAIAASIRYVADLVGVRHVALGSDFDGSVTTPFDVTGLPLVTSALLEAGFAPAEVRLIMGGNLLRLLGEALPAAPR